jgi:hypothetical protein
MVARALPRLAGGRPGPRAVAPPPTAETTSTAATPTPGTPATVPATRQRLTRRVTPRPVADNPRATPHPKVPGPRQHLHSVAFTHLKGPSAQPPPLDRHTSIHLVIGPGRVFVIDSKQYRGRLRLDPSGRRWHGRYPLAPALGAVSFDADQAAQVLPDPGMAVVPVVAVRGAQVPWGQGRRGGRTCGDGPAAAKHASPAPGRARARTGRRRGQSGLNPLPRCRWTAGTRPRRRLLPRALRCRLMNADCVGSAAPSAHCCPRMISGRA